MSKAPLARYHEATGQWNAAILVSQIAYWMPRAKIMRSGRLWVANSTAAWCEQTGLTRDQYRRAISHLRRIGFVETEQHLFAGKNVTHVRLTESGSERLVRNWQSPEKGVHAPLDGGSNPTPEVGTGAQLNTQEYNKENEHKRTTIACANAHAFPCSFSNKIPGKIDDTGKDHQSNKEKSFHPSATAKKFSSGRDTSEATTVQLAATWRAVNEHANGDFIPPLIGKELAQLKQFQARCPPGEAGLIMEICIRQWSDFTSCAAQDEAAWPVPGKPTIGFLLKYLKSAVNFVLKPMKVGAAPKPKLSTSSQLVIGSKKAPEDPKDAPATLDELLKIQNE